MYGSYAEISRLPVLFRVRQHECRHRPVLNLTGLEAN